MIKVRLQLSGEGGVGKVVRSPFVMARLIYQNEGPLAFYKGLSAGLLRQCTYGMSRLGIHRSVSEYLRDPKTKRISPWNSFIAGALAGGLGSITGTPADLVLVRMQSDSTLPPERRRNYKGVFHALRTIIRDEGFFAMWRGNMPTVIRAVAMNVGMLSTYDQSKMFCRTYMGENMANFTSSMVAGFFGSAAALPFDFVKTRIQKQKADADGRLPYTSQWDCVRKTVKTEGPFAFYKGFWTFYMRIAPHTVIALNVLEIVNQQAKKRGWQ